MGKNREKWFKVCMINNKGKQLKTKQRNKKKVWFTGVLEKRVQRKMERRKIIKEIINIFQSWRAWGTCRRPIFIPAQWLKKKKSNLREICEKNLYTEANEVSIRGIGWQETSCIQNFEMRKTSDFSVDALQVWKQWSDILKILRIMIFILEFCIIYQWCVMLSNIIFKHAKLKILLWIFLQESSRYVSVKCQTKSEKKKTRVLYSLEIERRLQDDSEAKLQVGKRTWKDIANLKSKNLELMEIDVFYYI